MHFAKVLVLLYFCAWRADRLPKLHRTPCSPSVPKLYGGNPNSGTPAELVWSMDGHIDCGILATKSFTRVAVGSEVLHHGIAPPGESGSQLRVKMEQWGEGPGGTSHVCP